MEEENDTSEVVRWERFLPQTVLGVLVVEQDDSTRHVISALLRKCSYKVTSVSDGLEAWGVLKEKHETIDIILTEVELPSISGFTLLTLVMDHDVCRKIPVIMMSSQDSISTVLKCMLKGAADFLIKPVRKNELKNLWQHIWRKQMSTAEIKSLSTGEDQKKIGATSERMVASSPSNDYISSGQLEVECKRTKSISKDFSQLECVDPMDHSKITINLDEESLRTEKDSGHGSKIEEKPQLETLCKGNSNSTMLGVSDDGTTMKRAKHDYSEGPKFQGEHKNGAFVLHGRGNLLLESPSLAAIDLIGSFGAGKRKYEISNAVAHSTCGSQLELTLQGSNPSGLRSSKAEGHFLNHSSASAFSRYNSSDRFRPSLPPSFMVNSKSQGTVNESKQLHQSYLQISNSNNGDSSTAAINEQSVKVENASASSLAWGTHQTDEPIQSVIQQSHSGCSKLQKGARANNVNAESSIGVHERENKSHKVDRTQFVAFGPCSSTIGGGNSVGTCTDLEDGNECSKNVKWDNDSGIANATTHIRGIDLPLGCRPNRLDTIHSSERQAALIKFREKRNKRTFDKKVRYQSRKQLAEQRPRLKGQFVRQIQTDSASSAG